MVLCINLSAADKAFAQLQYEHIRVKSHDRFLHLTVNVSTFRLIDCAYLRQVLHRKSLEWQRNERGLQLDRASLDCVK
jgi:hypothetical protein